MTSYSIGLPDDVFAQTGNMLRVALSCRLRSRLQPLTLLST